MNNNDNNRYYSFRIRLEKLKQKTWLLVVLAKILVLLATLATCYLRQS